MKHLIVFKALNMQTYKKKSFFLCLLLVFFVCSLSAKATTHFNFVPKQEHVKQCIKVIKLLEAHHFSNKKLNDNLSSQILHSFINDLDPAKQLFTLVDIANFKKHQFFLDDQLKSGYLNIIFNIFNLYLLRAKERLEYMSLLIKNVEGNFDLYKNENMISNNDLLTFKAKKEDLYPLWKKELKNTIISMSLERNATTEINNIDSIIKYKKEKQDNKISDENNTDSINAVIEKTYSNRLSLLKQTNSDDAFQIFMNALTSSFDPHTQFFSSKAFEDFDIRMSLSLEGIGAVLQNEYEFIKVVRLIPKGPADQSNLLMPGDKIIGVGQGRKGEIKDTIGQRLDNVVKLIRGPKNTFVRLKIIPAQGASDTAKIIHLQRDKVSLEEQSAQKNIININHNSKSFKLGIIEIPTFYIDFNAYHKGDPNYKSTTKDVRKLLMQLQKERVDGLIIDLRENSGGSLVEANQVTGLFIKSGPIVQVKTKSRIMRLYDEDAHIVFSLPVIVLINRMSASASEIFAGAIKDYQRGIIVGSQSFGKGTIQEIKTLGNAKLKITNAKFYRVSGESTQNLGIVPDIKYPPIYDEEITGESSFKKALNWDRIVPASFKPYKSLYPVISILNKLYTKRAQKDPGIIYLNQRKNLVFKKFDQPFISLNIDKRRAIKDKFDKMALDIENEYLKNTNQKPIEMLREKNSMVSDSNEDEQDEDILMNQTCLVLADFISLSNQLGFSW